MKTQHKKRLHAICSWVEVNAPFVASQLSDVISEGLLNVTENQEAVLEAVKVKMRSRACNYLECGDAEKTEEPLVGFSYCFRENEKKKLLSEAVQEVKKKGLLKNALEEMKQDDLPLSEDEKIVMLLSSPAEMPALQQVVNALLLIPVQRKTTAKNKNAQKEAQAKAIQLPVRVVIEKKQIVNVLLPNLNQRD